MREDLARMFSFMDGTAPQPDGDAQEMRDAMEAYFTHMYLTHMHQTDPDMHNDDDAPDIRSDESSAAQSDE